jgi:hypothetical protein
MCKLPASRARFRRLPLPPSLTGDATATDPVCHLAADHAQELAAVRTDAPNVYRLMGLRH